jgi:hypothetical protein
VWEEIVRTNALILSFTAAVCFLAWPASAKNPAYRIQTAPGEFDVTVYVAHSCHTPEAARRVAETTTSLLFGRIGVSVRFIHAEPPPADREAIALRVMEHAPGSLEPQVLGSAWVAREHPRADIFCDRLMQFYSATDWHEFGVIQGYAMAHELGHVLRANFGHSAEGVMRACWKRRDVILMLQGVVNFCRPDAERIREVLSERRREKLVRAGEN